MFAGKEMYYISISSNFIVGCRFTEVIRNPFYMMSQRILFFALLSIYGALAQLPPGWFGYENARWNECTNLFSTCTPTISSMLLSRRNTAEISWLDSTNWYSLFTTLFH